MNGSSSKILIDTGPSSRGWHRLEAYLRCPRLFALGYGRSGESAEMMAANQIRFPPTYPLVRGTIGHVGLAHLYARLKASQEGADPNAYYRPFEAMGLMVGRGLPHWGEMGVKAERSLRPLLAKYLASYASDSKKSIVGVEMLLEMEFDSYLYTARADLVYRDRDGKVWIMDHKITGRIESKSLSRYTLSGQFLGLTHLGFARWGDEFGGVIVNLLGEKDQRFLRDVIPPAPWALAEFPRLVVRTEEDIKRCENMLHSDAWGMRYPPTFSEFTCMTPYGRCAAWEMCRWGEEHGQG